MIELGYFSLAFAWLMTLFAVAAMLWSGHEPSSLLRSGYRAVTAAFLLALAASAALVVLLVQRDFHVEYVSQYTSRDLPLVYTVSAFWGGQAGSLLLWTLLLSFFGVIVLLQNQGKRDDLLPYVEATILGVQLFFLTLMLYGANPFATLETIPADGQGLNPLLQNPFMIVHPPFLYLGYVGFTIPFAFAIASLVLRKSDADWIRVTRRWTLVSWLLLTAGIVLGGHWAYLVLGWGGYWAWDPVENASLMPWLTATAFLHSVMIQEKKGMLKRWNLVLIILTFELCIFGTFLTRSGIISSVHSFAGSKLGPLFLLFLATSTLFSLFLLLSRVRETRTEQRILSLLSRESSFLLNNLLFVGITFAVFWGTTFPVMSRAVTGQTVSVSAPFFNSVIWPIALGLLILTGICPLIAWRKATFRNFRRNLLAPLVFGILTGAALWIAGVRGWIPVIFFSCAAFVTATALLEFFRGAKARSTTSGDNFARALLAVTLVNKRRYGGFFIHLGVATAFVGIIGSSFYSREFDFQLKPAQSTTVGDYRIDLLELAGRTDPNKEVVYARLRLYKQGKFMEELQPEKHFHRNSEQPQTQVSLLSRLTEDFYLILTGWEQDQTAVFKAYINPVVSVLWQGSSMVLLGTLFVLLPDSRRRRRQAAQGKADPQKTADSDETKSRPGAKEKRHAARVALGGLAIAFSVLSNWGTAAPPSVRDITSQLVCQCGCGNMIVANCDCSNAQTIKNDVAGLIRRGQDRNQILTSYVSRYGQSVLAAPPKKGFNLLAWLFPFVAILAAAIWLGRKLRSWRSAELAQPAKVGVSEADRQAYQDWIRQELENSR
ncbi:MAG: cytochrome c biogenesis protein CcsA [Acidobacteria bacterium]|nr:cytochrome c biogenesis protein CcsA [Acidobacteriota bacterium]